MAKLEPADPMIRFGIRLWMTSTLVRPKVIVPDICSRVNRPGPTLIAKSSKKWSFSRLMLIRCRNLKRALSEADKKKSLQNILSSDRIKF
ncbi:hypothetical protein Tco_1549104, partial [Tanacetum coccineum]